MAGAARFVVVGPGGCGIQVDESVGEWTEGTGPSVSSGSSKSSVSGLASDSRDARAGRFAGNAIARAVALAQSGKVQGIVTAPIDKATLLAGGYDYPGHTEMLEHLTGSPTAMMLASSKLRVVLATSHIALRDVPAALTAERLARTVRITREGMRRVFGIDDPRIALCALNPHAGDHGRFGTEDDDLLAPVARETGVAGPFPADTVFVRAIRGEFDCVIAPYHDVGMTAIKVASFGEGVNITLGLPFVRTSPDHGTALDIAGLGRASAASFIAAIETAVGILAR